LLPERPSFTTNVPNKDQIPVTLTAYRQIFAITLMAAMLLVSTPSESGVLLFQTPANRNNDYSGQGSPYTVQQLQALVAPIALYPDPLVAQILAGATYPDQIAAAEDYLQQNKALTGSALMQSVAGQPWDPAVKGLTVTPTVLANLAHNLAWTSQLGEAYQNQQPDVMSAIQALRAKALATGNLKSSSQLKVNQPTPDIITIQPANAQVVYLPVFNPAVVYGTPIQTPDYTASDAGAGNEISFASGIAVGALTNGGCCDWGWGAWNSNWYHGIAVYHDLPYSGNNVWHGGYYGGYNFYGNHTYHTVYDASHPYNAFQASAKDNSAINAGVAIGTAGGKLMVRTAAAANPYDSSSGGWTNSEDLRGWGPSDVGGPSSVFASWGNHPGASSFGNTGWGDRSASFRGWIAHGGAGGGWGNGGRLEGAH
jgi:hypothetical protein